MKTLNIELTYSELAFIMTIDVSEAKNIFMSELKEDKVSTKQTLLVKDLIKYFGLVKSVDSRYDGENQLMFNLEHKSENYKKYLSDKPSIKNKKFSGGKSVFYKICSREQIEHSERCFEASFKYLYPKGLNPKKLE